MSEPTVLSAADVQAQMKKVIAFAGTVGATAAAWKVAHSHEALRAERDRLLADARRLAQIAELWPRLNPWNENGAGMDLDAFWHINSLLTAPPTDAKE